MKDLIYYTRSRFLELQHLPDIASWLMIYNIIPYGGCFIDRSNTIQIPVRTTTLPSLTIPEAHLNFNLSFKECAIMQAQAIYKKHLQLGVPIRLSWSGGIDSTAALAAFIELLGVEKSKECLEILMTANGIIENPWVWENTVRKHNFKIVNMMHASNVINQSCITVNGEGGDQVHGADIFRQLVRVFGKSVFTKPWTESNITEFISARSAQNPGNAELLSHLLCKIIRAAPVEIVTLTDFWWWMNFCCKWGTVTYRSLARTSEQLSQEYLDNYYFPFYSSKEFQLWSMHRRDETHQGNWDTYKWAAKNFIIDTLNAPEYIDKHRQGSLYVIMSHTQKTLAIDSDFNFYDKLNPEDWYNPNNSFNV